ncbi:MAG: DUF3047 domain-containing protein [Deltaproteobacteria bacterium]|nr:DUF3047 domain-containing protein [Deltaproteobacteria bacterium]
MMIGQWLPVPIGSQPLPTIQQKTSIWEIRTAGNAGGFAFFLPKGKNPLPVRTHLEWSWSVEKYPKIGPKPPTQKEGDDYAIRVGALVAGNKSLVLPSELSKLVKRHGTAVSYIVFYCASENSKWWGRCIVNPFSDHVVNCFRGAANRMSKVSEMPLDDLVKTLALVAEEAAKLSVSGVWILSDSDNSASESLAHLGELKVTYDDSK